MQRTHRLRKGPEFDTVYAKGTVINGPLLVIRRSPNTLGHPRWGFAVGKRLAKQAVRRNRTRRRLRELARSLPVSDSFDFIVTARRGSIEATTSQLADALRRALRRAGVSLDDGMTP